MIIDHFWWPSLNKDLSWYLKTCHQCQTQSVAKVVLPPSISMPASLFQQTHTDTMFMPSSNGYDHIMQAHCSLSSWTEWRMLKSKMAHTLGTFLFEEILCRWGVIEEIVTDNGPPFVAAVNWLAEKYHIHHIHILAYNSQANGIVEWSHHTICDSLMKACDGDIMQWPKFMPYTFWADRITTCRATGHSPYFLAHGIKPLLPFNLTEATFMLPDISTPLSTAALVGLQACQLMKHDEDLTLACQWLFSSHLASVKDFECHFSSTIHNCDFSLGSLILVLNKKIETASNIKCKPRYFSPMVVISHSQGRSYRLMEVDRSVSKLKFAAFRLIPYHPHSKTSIEVTQFLNIHDLGGSVPEEI